MATYRAGSFKSQDDGTLYYGIQRKRLLGWKLQMYWVYGRDFLRLEIDKEAKAYGKEQMEKSIERLVAAGHTVI